MHVPGPESGRNPDQHEHFCWCFAVLACCLLLSCSLVKCIESPLPMLSLADLLPSCHVFALSWQVCSFLFIHPPPPSLFPCCALSAVSTNLDHHQSESPVPTKRPSSRSGTSESPLSSKRPRTAEKSATEQVSITQPQSCWQHGRPSENPFELFGLG